MKPEEKRAQVLQVLRQNARLQPEQIAERLALSVSEVREIIADAEKQSIIRGYYTLINDNAPGQQAVRALIEVSIQPERDSGFDRLARSISRFPEVTDVMLVSGSYDLLLIVNGASLQEVAHFVASRLSPLDGVRSTRTHFMLRKYKEAGFQLEEDERHERLSVTP
jgi:DNA-binding Lrp family transcriptional regulator